MEDPLEHDYSTEACFHGMQAGEIIGTNNNAKENKQMRRHRFTLRSLLVASAIAVLSLQAIVINAQQPINLKQGQTNPATITDSIWNVWNSIVQWLVNDSRSGGGGASTVRTSN